MIIRSALCLSGAVLMAGCAAFHNPETGQVQYKPDPERIEQVGAAAAGTVAVIPGWGPIAATLILGVAGALATHFRAKHQGENKGWEEAVASGATVKTPPKV